MSDDEADPELLELLRQSLGMGKPQTDEISSDTGEWSVYLQTAARKTTLRHVSLHLLNAQRSNRPPAC